MVKAVTVVEVHDEILKQTERWSVQLMDSDTFSDRSTSLTGVAYLMLRVAVSAIGACNGLKDKESVELSNEITTLISKAILEKHFKQGERK